MANKYQVSYFKRVGYKEHIDPISPFEKSYKVYTIFKNNTLKLNVKPDNPQNIKMYKSIIKNKTKANDISSLIVAKGLSFNDSIILGRSISNYIFEQLAWRLFYYQANVDDEKYQSYNWPINKRLQKKFFECKTGYELIDASISCLINTGKLPNRMRMIVASFFTKNLLQPWMDGEKFFKLYLEDYDRVLNRGNWIWCSQIAYDNQPFIRFFSPEIQLKKLLKSQEGIEWYSKWKPKTDTNKIVDWSESCNRYKEWKKNNQINKNNAKG